MTLAQTKMGAADRAQDDLAVRGYHEIDGGLDPAAAAMLHRRLLATRGFDGGLFLSEEAFDADPQYTGVNPRPGRNVLEHCEADLAFVEGDPSLTGVLGPLLGDDYHLLLKKVVCGVPASVIPGWITARIEGNPVNNLGAYVKPQFRDITYFYGIDYHQDLIDYPDRDADFVTVYVYLHEVGRHDAPLFVLEGSHRLGGDIFPHDLQRTAKGWLYGDRRGASVEVRERALTGPAGFTALWHACTLHGTQPDEADNARLSLRYLFARGPGRRRVGIDRVNDSLRGPLSIAATRRDLNGRGAAAIKANTINAARS